MDLVGHINNRNRHTSRSLFFVMHFYPKSWQKRSILLVLILLTSLTCWGNGTPASARDRSNLENYTIVGCKSFQQPYWPQEWSQNIFEVSAPAAQEGRDYECGFLTVPEHHDRSDGAEIQLAVAIIKSTAAHPEPDPLVLLQGGPGGSGITQFASLANSQTPGSAALRADRDLN
jgi:hypothetical protein